MFFLHFTSLHSPSPLPPPSSHPNNLSSSYSTSATIFLLRSGFTTTVPGAECLTLLLFFLASESICTRLALAALAIAGGSLRCLSILRTSGRCL